MPSLKRNRSSPSPSPWSDFPEDASDSLADDKGNGDHGFDEALLPSAPSKGTKSKAGAKVSTPKKGVKKEIPGTSGTPKAEGSAVPSSKDFGPEHQVQLNLAIRDLWSSSSGMVLDSYPLLAPYKAKGRIHRHFHALLNAAPGGPEGLKLFEATKKSGANSASAPGTPKTPKRAKKEE